ncbi:MAG: DNA-methyltransferase [Candidatus Hodarchaeales archaeon]
MKTTHKIYFQNAKQMNQLSDETIDLVITSPPYPLISMWDTQFSELSSEVEHSFSTNDYSTIFESMHSELDAIWNELSRVLKPGGICCINIGDSVRTLNKSFQLYPNQARVTTKFVSLGFSPLPRIIWRKPTNAPNKFMGSGMLPPNAYVTLEHESILILRKGGIRSFKTEPQKQKRRESAYFWEERNTWFSDIWDLRGVTQNINNSDSRNRSGAFPFELAYRLVNMYSLKEDQILDPFLGTGTTMFAAMAAARNSIGYEIEKSLESIILETLNDIIKIGNEKIEERLNNHEEFITARINSGKEVKHINNKYNFPVITQQEKSLILNQLRGISKHPNHIYEITYSEHKGE